MYGSYYGSGATSSLAKTASMVQGVAIWAIVSIILAVIGGIVLYFTFLSKKNENKFKGFVAWMYDFLTFKKMLAENLLKILYLVFAIFITLFSFALIGVNFLAFLGYLVIGNVLARLTYELMLVILVICRNTTEIAKNTKTEINKKMSNKDEK